MSDLQLVDPSQWPSTPPVPNLQIPNQGPGSRRYRTSEDGTTFWCMSCDTKLDRRVMHCKEHERERTNLRQGGHLPRQATIDGFAEITRTADGILKLLGEATVQFRRLKLGKTPRRNSAEFENWRIEHLRLLNCFMLESKNLKILIDEHVKPLTPSLTNPQPD